MLKIMGSLHKKCVVVGDGNVGKTCLMKTFVDNAFPETYIPTVYDNYTAMMKFEDRVVNLGLWDTAGQADYDRLRPLSYPQTDVFLICFSLNNSDTYEHVKVKWFPEVHHHCPSVPIVLVGTKSDLRDNNNPVSQTTPINPNRNSIVSTDQGQQLKKLIGARYYIECSSRTQLGIKEVFDAALKAVFEPPPKKQRNCPIL